MKKSIAFLMMMMLGVSAPSLAQQTVEEETNYIEHMIRRGEDFASIAQKYGITEQQLRDANPQYKTVYAGLKLRVPQNNIANMPKATNQEGEVAPKVANGGQDISKSRTASQSEGQPSQSEAQKKDEATKQVVDTRQTMPSQQSPYSDPNLRPNSIDDFKFYINSKDHTAKIVKCVKCKKLNGTVVIPSTFTYGGEKYTVTGIGYQAFEFESNITTIIIPNTVTFIGQEAFQFCTKLSSINIPHGIVWIGNSAFYGCSSLSSVKLPNTLETIGERAFESCRALCSIDFPNSVTEIFEYAFFNCSSLTSIKLSENIKIIGAVAFSRCNLESVYIPNSIKEIGAGAFSENKQLQFASIPNTITFADMNGKRAVRNGVFVDTPLKKVTRRKENSNQTISDTSWQWFHIDNPNPRPSSPDPRTLASNGIDPNSMSWPAPKYQPEWHYGNGDPYVIVGWDINGIFRTTTIDAYSGNVRGYYVQKLGEYYYTYADAEAAAYYYLKYNKIRTRNKW